MSTRGLTRWVIAHRRATLLIWVGLLIVSLIGSKAIGTREVTNLTLPGTDSQKATDVLERDFPTQSGDADQVVFRAREGAVRTEPTRSQITSVLAKIGRAPHVAAVTGPFSRGDSRQISDDGRIAFATVHFDESANDLPTDAIKSVVTLGEEARSSQLQVELGGPAIEQSQRPAFGAATAVGILAAIVVLLISFGTLVAMGLPIITALLGLGTGISLTAFSSQVLDTPFFAKELAVMIGLGVGIDYALFIVTRFRENYRGGDSVEDAVVAAMDTSGRAVIFAGSTVIIALLGMFAVGIQFLHGVAVSASIAVLLTMLATLTVLPALLSRFGARVGRERPRRRLTAARKPQPGAMRRAPAATRWAGFVQRHPWPTAILGLAIMLALIIPVLGIRLASSDAGNDPTSQTTRRAFDLLGEGFGPGFNGPLQVVATVESGAKVGSLAPVTSALEAEPDIASVAPPTLSPNGRTAVLIADPRSAPQAQATTDLVEHLRDTTLPSVEAKTDTSLLVAGATATQVDFSRVLSAKIPLFIAIVVLLSAILLFLVFRSLVIPVQAAAMNLLSIGASLGAAVLVFQHGWLGGLLGIEPGPIDAFIPVMLFAIVFGLSMDYEVFLISRVHEEWRRSGKASDAVVRGFGSTGRVITAAALIMICVFLSFALIDQRVVKLFGFTLATAVFLDAFVVRSLLLPAVLQLLGARTWWMPRWLAGRMPRIAIEAEPPTAAPVERS